MRGVRTAHWGTVLLASALLVQSCQAYSQAQLKSMRAERWRLPFFEFQNHICPRVQYGCDFMTPPGDACFPFTFTGYGTVGCCTPGYTCTGDSSSFTGYSCTPVPVAALSYSFGYSYFDSTCYVKAQPSAQCGVNGQYNGYCCPNGYSCRPQPTSYASNYVSWTCQADVNSAPPAPANLTLVYPPRQLPPGSCTCRLTSNGERVPADCPSPWSSPAGETQVAPALSISNGKIVESASGTAAGLHGINWFGWETGAYNLDGLYAYCDDNSTSCAQDGEVPPSNYPSVAIGDAGQNKLQMYFWKRTMTGDFATILWRLKLLGFNAIRVPFRFEFLNNDLPPPNGGSKTEFFNCMNDDHSYIANTKTLDPQLSSSSFPATAFPSYTGMPHPVPNISTNPNCSGAWEAPFVNGYTTAGQGDTFKATVCNWYLPQGPNVPAIQRFLWQVQYMVSQGFYVLVDYHSYAEPNPDILDPVLFATNWRNLWKIFGDLPQYEASMKGRVFPDLVNEASRWGCQWERTCSNVNGTRTCAAGYELLLGAARAIHTIDPVVPVFFNGMGQAGVDPKVFPDCSNAYPGANWGEGFITDNGVLKQFNLTSDASIMFAYNSQAGNQLVLAPHVYPSSISGYDVAVQRDGALEARFDVSWGKKAAGEDVTSSGRPIGVVPLVVGEFGAKDQGENAVSNTDTTIYNDDDKQFFSRLGTYLQARAGQTGAKPSWFFWSWNANSGDTQGIVGPETTWREVQWTKVRMLTQYFGLRPWFCSAAPDICSNVRAW